ncbi:MAG TPA: invertase [Firmicutes bacterium]|nr:invertase [Bacillota bacterium]
MVYGYIRISTDTQTVENQRFEIEKYAEKNNIKIDKYIEEIVSGAKQYNKRRLGLLLKRVNKGDTIIISELSRLGRTLYMIMDILNGCLNKEIKIISIKDGFKLEDDISSKVLAFAFGLSAEIERKLISQRTKEALSRLKNKGVKLGRRKGSKNKHTKLEKYTNRIITAFNNGETKANLARKYKVHINTIYAFIEKHNKKIISV